jgi:hypothetical protein
MRQPTSPWFLGHIHHIDFHHSGRDVNRAATDRTAARYRLAPAPAERLSAIAIEAAAFRFLIRALAHKPTALD